MDEYCLYLRKSRADREAELRGEGETLARHEATLLALAKSMNKHITKIYREIVSGETIAARPCMRELLEEVEAGIWKGVFVMEVERLARGDTIDQGIVSRAFRLTGTQIITPIKTYNPNDEFDEEYFEFGLFMSRREYKTIRRRLQRGREASVKEGKYCGNRSPYGYERKKLQNDKGFSLEVNPEQASVVKNIYEWYTVGVLKEDGTRERIGMSKICNRLNDLHVRTIYGGPWTLATVNGILTNPVYIGKIRWEYRKTEKQIEDGQIKTSRPRNKNYILNDGMHEAIIDADTFYRVQDFLKKRALPATPGKAKVANPLSGIVRCCICGKAMVRRPYTNRTIRDALICQTPHCATVSSPLEDVERELIAGLSSWLANYKVNWEGAALPDSESSVSMIQTLCQSAEEKLEKLNQQLNNTYDLLEQGIYTKEVFLKRNKALSESIANARADLERYQADLELERKREAAKTNIIPNVERLLDVYWQLPDARSKNELIKNVLEKAVYSKTKKNNPNSKVYHPFTLDLYPKLPESP